MPRINVSTSAWYGLATPLFFAGFKRVVEFCSLLMGALKKKTWKKHYNFTITGWWLSHLPLWKIMEYKSVGMIIMIPNIFARCWWAFYMKKPWKNMEKHQLVGGSSGDVLPMDPMIWDSTHGSSTVTQIWGSNHWLIAKIIMAGGSRFVHVHPCPSRNLSGSYPYILAEADEPCRSRGEKIQEFGPSDFHTNLRLKYIDNTW